MIAPGSEIHIANSGEDPEPPAANGRRRSRWRWAINVAYAAVLVTVALLPSVPEVIGVSVPDWFAHAAAYGVQGGLIFWARLPETGVVVAAGSGVAGATAFGLVTEALQVLQPARTVEAVDLLANTVGAILVCGLVTVGWAVVSRHRR